MRVTNASRVLNTFNILSVTTVQTYEPCCLPTRSKQMMSVYVMKYGRSGDISEPIANLDYRGRCVVNLNLPAGRKPRYSLKGKWLNHTASLHDLEQRKPRACPGIRTSDHPPPTIVDEWTG